MTQDTTPAVTGPGRIGREGLSAVLDEAATAALRAPSIYNSQPWKWRVGIGTLELRADSDRRLTAADPEGRMLTVSCGVALHHALIALGALGYRSAVTYLPETSDPELLARIEPLGHRPPTPVDSRHYQALLRRRTDRRPFGDQPVPAESVEVLRAEAESHGVHLHVLRPDDLPTLLVAGSTAASAQLTDAAQRAELATWTHRPEEAKDGVPATTTVRDTARRVPLRTFALDGGDQLQPGAEHDIGTTYAVLWGDNDGRRAWLHAGEALSAVLLAATDLGLAASPMSDVVEVTASRIALRRMLNWLGHPFVMVRVGVFTPAEVIPPTPRRDHDDVVTTDRDDDRSGGESGA